MNKYLCVAVCILSAACGEGGGTGGTGGSGGTGSDAGSEGNTASGCKTAPPVWQPTGERVTWNGISFIVPPGMTGSDRTTHYELVAVGNGNGLNTCGITLNLPQQATGDLATQASELLTQAYASSGYQVLDDNYGTDLLGNRTVGRSAKGWDYVELRAELRKGQPSPERGHILLIKLGALVVPILGYSPTSAGCTQLAHDFTTGIIGELRWRQLEYSLEFAGLQAAPQAVVGHWSLFQGSSGQEYVFAANGRYQFWGGLGQAHVVSNTEIELTTSQFSGDGAYAVSGSTVTLCPAAAAAQSFLFRRFEQHAVSPSGVRSQTSGLGLMKTDVAGPYEVPLERT